MYYADIKFPDVANGPGVRVSLFVSGCTHHCKECFNQEAWDFKYGSFFDTEARNKIFKILENSYTDGITFLGGEPMEPGNQNSVLSLIKDIKERFPDKNIWIYSGYTFEELTNQVLNRCFCEDTTMEILHLSDVLVDGRFEIDKKILGLKFRGSSNQRVIDLKGTFENNSIKLLYN